MSREGMNILSKKKVKHIIAAIGFVFFCYVMAVFNHYKSTQEIHFNIFTSQTLTDFLIFTAIIIPIFFLMKTSIGKKTDKKD